MAGYLKASHERIAVMEASIISLQRECYRKDEALKAVNVLSPGETLVLSQSSSPLLQSASAPSRRELSSRTAGAESNSHTTSGGVRGAESNGDGMLEHVLGDDGGGRPLELAGEKPLDRRAHILHTSAIHSPSMPPPHLEAPRTGSATRAAVPHERDDTHGVGERAKGADRQRERGRERAVAVVRVEQSAFDMMEEDELLLWQRHDMQELAHAFGLQLEQETPAGLGEAGTERRKEREREREREREKSIDGGSRESERGVQDGGEDAHSVRSSRGARRADSALAGSSGGGGSSDAVGGEHLGGPSGVLQLQLSSAGPSNSNHSAQFSTPVLPNTLTADVDAGRGGGVRGGGGGGGAEGGGRAGGIDTCGCRAGDDRGQDMPDMQDCRSGGRDVSGEAPGGGSPRERRVSYASLC